MPVDVTDRSRRMERSKRTAWGSCVALKVHRDTPPHCYLTSDKRKIGVCVVGRYPAGGRDITISFT